MGIITLEEFFMGRDKTYAPDLTDAILASAKETVLRANAMLAAAALDGAAPTLDMATKSFVASGWRPAAVNDRTSNAAVFSKHMIGQALDIRDNHTTRVLCRWALGHQAKLAEIGLWCERPQWTPSWLHIQTQPPKSGSRFFIPSTAAPLCAALPGET